MLKLPGYTDDPLIDGCEALDDPLFWPVHLLQYTGGDPDELCAAFDIDEAEIWRSYRRLSDEHRWPAFSISLPSGHLLSLVYRNFKEDSGYDYHLHHPGWAKPVLLATVEGHYLGPGLCWDELLAVSRSGAITGATLSAEGHMLLLLPIMADTQDRRQDRHRPAHRRTGPAIPGTDRQPAQPRPHHHRDGGSLH